MMRVSYWNQVRGVFFSFLLLGVTGCGNSSALDEPRVFVVQASPADIYSDALVKLKPILADKTKIIREDFENGIVVRFSVSSPENKKLKLVELTVTDNGTGQSTLSAKAETFSFTRTAKRDVTDVQIENLVHDLLVR